MTAALATDQFLTFFVGEDQFAAAAADVTEVFRHPEITRVPNGPPSLLGLAWLRGAPAPVVSVARLLDRPEQASGEGRLLLISGEQPIGLMVDRIGALADLPLRSSGDAETGSRQGFGRLYWVEDAALRVLDLDGLLRRAFTAGFGRARRTTTGLDDGQRDHVSAAEDEGQDQVALLGFEVAGQAYALPLEEVGEVLALPPRMAEIAQSDDAALGVVDLRGALLPIVSLRRLLGLPAAHAVTDRVVVARIGEARVGLAVDRLRAILRTPADRIDPAPAVLNRGAGEAQVQAICRLPDSGGLVALLSGERLFRDEKVAHILADGQQGRDAMDDVSAQDQALERFLIFRLGDEEYGLPLAVVDEVVQLPERLTRAPKAPAFIEGVANLRGKVTPIIDQRRRFSATQSADRQSSARPRVVVTTVQGRQAGFIVDGVSEIMALSPSQMTETPELTADAGRLFSRVATLDGGQRLVLLVEPKELLDRAERDMLAGLDASTVAAGT